MKELVVWWRPPFQILRTTFSAACHWLYVAWLAEPEGFTSDTKLS
jgi:hypothetical protein